MRGNCSRQHQSIPEKMLGTKDSKWSHLKLVFFLTKLAFGQRTAHASTTDKVHGVQTGQAGYKQKDCQTLPRQDKTVFKIFQPLKIVCQLL